MPPIIQSGADQSPAIFLQNSQPDHDLMARLPKLPTRLKVLNARSAQDEEVGGIDEAKGVGVVSETASVRVGIG